MGRPPSSIAVIAIAAFVAGAVAAQEPSQPTFRGGIELLTIDVSVVDGAGRPVRGLTPSDFGVEIGGKARSVARADFIDFSASVPRPDLLEVTSNQPSGGAPEPRLILILVDDESFGPLEGRDVFRALAAQVPRLFEGDFLGFAPLSGRGPVVEYTTSRRPVAEALERLSGRRMPPPPMQAQMALTEALEIANGNSITFDRVADRECPNMIGIGGNERAPGAGRNLCKIQIEKEAKQLSSEERQVTDRSLAALLRHLEALRGFPGSKYLLLVSRGFIIDESHGPAVQVGRAAAVAGVTVHVLHIDRDVVFDASTARFSPNGGDDRRARFAALTTIGDAAGGSVHRVLGDGTLAIEQVRSEMAAVYRLGIETLPEDASGGARRIRVRVNGRNVDVRAHREVLLPERVETRSPSERLLRALRSPIVERGIGIRLATFAFRGDTGDTRLIVSVEADTESADLRGAYALRNEAGTLVKAIEIGPERVISEPGAPPLIVFHEALAAGSYSVTVALVDGKGRAGSAVRLVSLRAPQGETLVLGDLIVLPEGTGPGRLRPSTRIPRGSERATAFFELHAEGGQVPGTVPVTLDVAETADGPALLSATIDVPLQLRDGRAVTSGEIRFSPAALTPGRYLARLTATGSSTRALRSFTIEE